MPCDAQRTPNTRSRARMARRTAWRGALGALGCPPLLACSILGQADWSCGRDGVAGCTGGSGCTTSRCEPGGEGQGPGRPPFIIGADISWTLEDERGGARYFDRGVQQDLVEILVQHGFNYVRLRTFVDPAAVGGYAEGALEPWNDLDHTIEMAQRVYGRGLGFLLNFHYSDTWADPGHQTKPLAWRELSQEELTARVYDYTAHSLRELAAAGVPPHLVQVGNEITAGMLHPDGLSYPEENWPKLAALLQAGIAAVRDTAPNARVMLQIEKCNDNDASRWWLDSALREGIEFDILAQSCYTAYHGTPSDWQANFADLAQRYPELSFVVGEYSHEKRAVNDILFGLPGRRGLGSFIWEPTRWMERVFDQGADQTYHTNALIDLYPQMASDYGL